MQYYSVGDLATTIFTYEFDSDTGYASVSQISGWLSGNVGNLNNRTFQSFAVSGDNFTPTGSFQQEEASILQQSYLYEFYTKKTRSVLRGLDSSIDFITLKEGDSVITRTNKNEIAKTYRSLAQDSLGELNSLVAKYNFYQAAPSQVAGSDIGTGCST